MAIVSMSRLRDEYASFLVQYADDGRLTLFLR